MKDRIKQIRNSLGLTQQKFADRLGLKRQTIAAYEIGNIKPSDSTIILICKEFNINKEWLENGEGEPQKNININFGKMCADIGVNDPKAREAIEKYYELTPKDKELFWNFIERFIKWNSI